MQRETTKVEQLFNSLIKLPVHQRQTHLESLKCGPKLKSVVTRLLKAHESQSSFLNQNLASDLVRMDPEFLESFGAVEESGFVAGQRVGDFEIHSRLGQGGMSTVYRAIQIAPIKRWVALKFIRPSILAPKTIRRFLREQQALALAAHPNIASLYEVNSTEDGIPYAVIEWIDGHPINQYCQQNQIGFRQRIQLFIQACAALHHAHSQGIIHRDIKPQNILVARGKNGPVVKLIDFGIAKLDEIHGSNNETMTMFGQILGSPRYMSPEQLNGHAVEATTDVYSAGLVLFELLCGEPFRNEPSNEFWKNELAAQPVLSHHLKGKQASNESASYLKRGLDRVLARATAADREQRYQSIAQFGIDLKAILANQPISISPPNAITRFKRVVTSRLNKLSAATTILAVVLVMLMAGVAGYATLKWRESEMELSQFEADQADSESRQGLANDLIMRLAATDEYQLSPANFDTNLIPVYQAQADSIKEMGGPKSDEEKTVYGVLALLYAMANDFDRADTLLERVDNEKAASELHLVREKICQRFAEVAVMDLRQTEGLPNDVQRARKQVTLARCYLVLGKYQESKPLLQQSLSYFDKTDPQGLDALVIRTHLIKTLMRLDEQQQYQSLLDETYQRFKDAQALRRTERGKAEMSKILKLIQSKRPNPSKNSG